MQNKALQKKPSSTVIVLGSILQKRSEKNAEKNGFTSKNKKTLNLVCLSEENKKKKKEKWETYDVQNVAA